MIKELQQKIYDFEWYIKSISLIGSFVLFAYYVIHGDKPDFRLRQILNKYA